MRTRAFAREGVLGRDGGLPESRLAWRPTRDLVGRLVVVVDAALAAKQRVVDAVGVGLDVSVESLEHRADGVARVPRLYSKKTWSLSASTTKKCPLVHACRCPVASGAGWMATPVASVERQKAVCFASLAHASTMTPERRSDVLGVAAHRAVVELEPFAREHLARGDGTECPNGTS